jgi:hypothetical protein
MKDAQRRGRSGEGCMLASGSAGLKGGLTWISSRY